MAKSTRKSSEKSSRKDLKSMSFEDAGRQNKKQAKREAKLMLKLSEANADVQKAEKKLAKAVLDVQKYEASLEELRQNSRGEQDEEVAVIVTTTTPEGFDEIDAQIVEEILEEVLHATDADLTENQENGLQPEETTSETSEEALGQAQPEQDEYQNAPTVPNLTSDQPELDEKPADASHSFHQNEYEAGDTQPYPTGQGGLLEPSEGNEATDQHETSEESTSQAEEQQDHTEELSDPAEVSSPKSTEEEKTTDQHNDEEEAEYQNGDTQPHPAIKPPLRDVTSYND